MDTPTTFDDFKVFISQETGYPQTKINAHSMLVKDIRIYGDDVDELLQKYKQQYGVSLTGFDYHAHFAPEGLCLTAMLVIWIKKLFGKEPPHLKDLTVGELYNGILEKKLKNAIR